MLSAANALSACRLLALGAKHMALGVPSFAHALRRLRGPTHAAWPLLLLALRAVAETQSCTYLYACTT